MVHSTDETIRLYRDTLMLLAEGAFANPQELVESERFPGGSTKEDLINDIIREMEYAIATRSVTVTTINAEARLLGKGRDL